MTLCVSLKGVRESTEDRSQYNPSLGSGLNPAPSTYVADFSPFTAIFHQAKKKEGAKPKYARWSYTKTVVDTWRRQSTKEYFTVDTVIRLPNQEDKNKEKSNYGEGEK
jgi:hypothetical protein